MEKRFEIQPVVISPFKREFKRELTISGHLFRYLRIEADNRGISPSETARQLILWHLGLDDENKLIHAFNTKISNLNLAKRISLDEMMINVLANALQVIELKKNRSKLQCKRNHQ